MFFKRFQFLRFFNLFLAIPGSTSTCSSSYQESASLCRLVQPFIVLSSHHRLSEKEKETPSEKYWILDRSGTRMCQHWQLQFSHGYHYRSQYDSRGKIETDLDQNSKWKICCTWTPNGSKFKFFKLPFNPQSCHFAVRGRHWPTSTHCYPLFFFTCQRSLCG